jgi:hypothetical protein
MAQTTTQVSAVDAKVEVSANGSAWTDISGTANKIDLSAQDRNVGAAFTFEGDGAVLTYGKRQPIDVTVTALYMACTAPARERSRVSNTRPSTRRAGTQLLSRSRSRLRTSPAPLA